MALVNGIPESKKLLVIFRMEPGSLGPDGIQHINKFCEFAQQELQASASAFIAFSIEPRIDKTLAEMEFQVSSKKLSRSRADQYLNMFTENIDHFAEQLEDSLEALINQYFGR